MAAAIKEGLLQRKSPYTFSKPTFLEPSGVPNGNEEFRKMSFRERIGAMNTQATELNAQFPVPTVILVYGLFGVCWWFAYQKFCMEPSLPFFADLNIKRFIIYNTFINTLGFGATSSLLGFRFKLAFGCGLHFLTPGTLCAPLIPSLAKTLGYPKSPGIRSIQAIAAYIFLIVALQRALITPEWPQLKLVYIAMVLCLLFDFSIVQSCRLEHNGYMLVALAFPDWVNGLQVVQCGLWFWAGTAKIGPWWKYVIPFIAKDNIFCPVLPEGLIKRLLITESTVTTEKGDVTSFRPSKLSVIMSYMGCGFELFMGTAVCSSRGSILNSLGVYGACLYHCFIGICAPFASVQEWNYFSIIMCIYLFKYNEFAMPTSPYLQAFLLIVSCIVPIWGQLIPTQVPFLTAYRPYMGNWRFSWYILHKSAEEKHEKLTTNCNPWVGEDGAWFYGLLGGCGKQGKEMMEFFDYALTSPLLSVPGYRPLVSVVEKLLEENGWDLNDIRISQSEPYQNQVFGWSLGTGWIAARECARKALVEKCGFGPKEMYMINFEPASPIPWGSTPPFGQRVQWRCYDVTKGPWDAQIHGNLPYSECEKSNNAADLVLKESDHKKGKSLRGTFLCFDGYW